MNEREREPERPNDLLWAAVEERANRVDTAPPGFAGRVLAAMKRERLAARAKAPAAGFAPAWVFSAVGAAAAAAVGVVLVWYGTQNPDALTALADAAAAEQTLNLDHLVAVMGGLAGAAATLGALAYYYLVPRR